MRWFARAWIILCLAVVAYDASAHELQPASFELRQLGAERYEAIWRAPTYYREPHPASLQFPDSWRSVAEPKVTQLPDATLHRHLLEVPDGALDGAIIRFVGL